MVKILVARSSEGNRTLASMLEREGFEPIAVDVLSFLPPSRWDKVDSVINSINKFDWVVLTSATGVSFFLKRVREVGRRCDLKNVSFAAVGPKTAACLERAGLKKVFIPSKYTTEQLAKELPKKGKNVLLLRSNIASKEVVKILKKRGFDVINVVIYRTLKKYNSVSIEVPDGIVFGSPSEVRALSSICENLDKMKSLPAFCIGPVTRKEAEIAGFRNTIIPPNYTFDSLVEQIKRYFL